MPKRFATTTKPSFSTFNEAPLHAALKAWYRRARDRVEAPVDGYVIDLVRGKRLIEIQTGNFSAIRRKLEALLVRHPVRLVYPVEAQKWLVKLPREKGKAPARRKSPKRGRVEHVFQELVSLAHLVPEKNFSLEVVLAHVEEARRYDGKRGWRRGGWVTHERRLIEVVGQRTFECPTDFLALLPESLDEPFTTAELAAAWGVPRWLAQKGAYCLHRMGALARCGKRGNAWRYRRARD